MSFRRGLISFAVLATALQVSGATQNYAAVIGYPARVTASTIDRAGNVYLAGTTTSASIVVTENAVQKSFAQATCGYIQGSNGSPNIPNPCSHGFVVKVDATGTRLTYATYLGGSSGDSITSISTDGDGNAYVTGGTSSNDFPVTPGAYLTKGSGFVTKLNADGSAILFSTRLPEAGVALAVDAAGSAYVTGSAEGTSFPTTPGAFQTIRYVDAQDVFVLKLRPDGSNVQYATLLGGSLKDIPAAISVDAGGNAYIAGVTASSASFSRLGGPDFVPFPTTPGAFSVPGAIGTVFIAKLNAQGTGLIFSSVFGGSGYYDQVNAIAVSRSGSVYFAGGTYYSPDFPVTASAFQKTYGGGFVGELTADGSQLVYSTYLGTGKGDLVGQIAVDSDGHAFVSGTVSRSSFPTTPNADEVCFPSSGTTPSFYAELNAEGSALLYATYSGGSVLSVDSTGGFYSASATQILRRVDSSAPVLAGIRCVASSANGRAGAIVPGELISLYGPQIGPDKTASAQTDTSGKIPTTLAGIRVLLNEIPAPVLYVGMDQVNAVVPFAMGAATSAEIRIQRESVDLPPVTVPVAATAPGAFTLDGSGYGQLAAVNQDGTVNSWQHPAAQGSVVALYLTGFGQMQPFPPEGSIPQGPTAKPVLKCSAAIDGLPSVDVLYCGDAPGLIEGVIQMNIRIPQLDEAGQVGVYVNIGESSIANGGLVTIAVK